MRILFERKGGKTVLFRAPFLALAGILCMLTLGCGDWSTGNDAHGDIFSRRFHYYYMDVCRYDSFGPYDCSGVGTLSSPMNIALRIEYDGYATLNLDGERFYYNARDYAHDFDVEYGDYYYQFYESDGSMTLYEDGYEAIYVDERAGEAYYYYRDLY